MKDIPLYDVLIKVPRHGIHNKVNYHSFQPVYFTIVPFKCDACGETIFPLSKVVRCIRCFSYCHRHCMQSVRFKCPGVDEGSTGGNDSPQCTGGCQFTQRDEAAKARRKQNTNGSSKLMKSFGPEEDICIWQTTLSAIAGDNSSLWTAKCLPPRLIPRAAPTPANSAGYRDWNLLVRSLLSDGSSLPGIACSRLHALFMDLNFRDCDSCFSHARMCLDCISCALLTVLPHRISNEQNLTLEVVTLAEHYVLSLSRNSMYHMLHAFAKRSGQRIRNREEMHDVLLDSSTSFPMSSLTPELELALKQLVGSLAVNDKLKALVGILRQITAPPSPPPAAIDIDTENRLLLPATVAEIGADELVSRVTALIHASAQSGLGISWHAECYYIDKLSRGEDWRIGLEGYALTTFMQALHAIDMTADKK